MFLFPLMSADSTLRDNNISKNYHWNELNISDWFKGCIEEELIRRNYKIIKTDVYVNICSRMNSLGLVYTINLDTQKNNKNYILENFTTTSEYNEGLDGFMWFMDFFKEKEAEAILKFSKNVLELGFETKREFLGIKNIEAKETHSGETEFDITINCTKEEFVKFLTEEEMIMIWNSNAIVEGETLRMANFEIKFILIEEKKIDILFKINNWKEYSKGTIKLETIRGNTKVTVKLSNVPLSDIDTLKPLWTQGIIMPACVTFGFGIVNQ